MKAKIPTTIEVNITHVLVNLPVRYDEEDIPNDFPLREGKMWNAKIEIDTGKIEGWPMGQVGEFYMKVVDEGTYRLRSATRLCELAASHGSPDDLRLVKIP